VWLDSGGQTSSEYDVAVGAVILSVDNSRIQLLDDDKQVCIIQQLNVVFSAVVVSRIIYALYAWGGFLSNDLIAKLDASFKKAFRWGYSCDLRRLSVLLHEADEHLFHEMVYNKDHCIHQLLPLEKILPMKFRATNCIFALPQCHYNLYKCSFVLRYLFGDAY